jgi:hypothetical protein
MKNKTPMVLDSKKLSAKSSLMMLRNRDTKTNITSADYEMQSSCLTSCRNINSNITSAFGSSSRLNSNK